MSLLFTMLPIYIFGNLHCLGMCGPLVLMIGQHRYSYFYFLGRTLSFTIAGFICGTLGSVIHFGFKSYHLPELVSFIFGILFLFLGISALKEWSYPGFAWLSKYLGRLSQNLSLLMLRDQPWPVFLFGFFTLLLPCGQTLIVFSACALSGDPTVGALNGFVFALLTSPSLFFAMKAHALFRTARVYYNKVIGVSSLLIGGLSILRGFAEMGVLSHWVLNPNAHPYYHLVIF